MSKRSVSFYDLQQPLELARPRLDSAWNRLMEHRLFVGGPEVEEFEEAFASYCRVPHAIGVANGSDAIELVLKGLGIEPGSEVIVPTNTFIATAAAVCNVGAIPRFVDVDPDTLLLTAETARAAITPATSAIIAVHLYGQPCDLDELSALAASAGIPLIEDAAQAHGAEYRGQRIGGHSSAATFSFYPGKNLGAFGDGGAVVTTDAALADRIRMLSRHGRSIHDRDAHEVVGRNSRLDSVQAAMLQVRLETLDQENKHRQLVHGWYGEMLPQSVELVAQAPGTLSSHHLIVAQVDDRDRVRAELDERGVGTGIHYRTCCHLQPAFGGLASRSLPVAEAAAERIVSLPVHTRITQDDVAYVCEQLRQIAPPRS